MCLSPEVEVASFHSGVESMKFINLRLLRAVLLASIALAGLTISVVADEIYSGPQVGEKLPPFEVQGVFGDAAGKVLDFVTDADQSPVVLFFVHDVNRQSISMTRILSRYTSGRKKDGLHTGVVWLSDDVTEAENQLKRIRHAMAEDAPLGISVDGAEGPGSYGLNRNVMLTILVGHKAQVTANFALVQPSLQADGQKILDAIAAVAGGPVQRLEDLPEVKDMMTQQTKRTEPPNLRPLLAPMIQRDATPEEVDQAAKAVEDKAAKDEAVRKEIGRIASTIVNAGKLEDYGTPKAQEYLRKWAEKFGPSEKKEGPAERGTARPSKPADEPKK
jgi:hypothetical protein